MGEEMDSRADSKTGAAACVVVLLLCFSIPQLVSCAVPTESLANIDGPPYPENNPPHDLGFTYEPNDPDNGIRVFLNATALDDEGDNLTYSWDFGDGEFGSGQNVMHQFRNAGDNNVTLLVDDGASGADPRPVTTTTTISVTENHAPSIDAFDDLLYAHVGLPVNCWANVTDTDTGDRIRVTWEWGEGNLTVIEYQSTGGMVEVWTNYTYQWPAGNVTVWADDLTGLPGHNVSDSGWIVVRVSHNRPSITLFTVDNSHPVSGERVTFSVSVTDADHDDIKLQFHFGDGTTSEEMFVRWNGPIVKMTHVYAEPGMMGSYVTASDGMPVISPTILLNVSPASVNLSLAAGWNLVSVPLVDWGGNASKLGLDYGDIVVGWNSSSKRYDKNYIVGKSPPSLDFIIPGSTGFWVYAQSATTIQINGTVPNSVQTRDIVVPPGGGWVMIGFNTLNSTWHASSIPAMFSGGAITAVARYAPPGYVILIVGAPFPTDFVLTPGEGYWCYCTASGTLSYSP